MAAIVIVVARIVIVVCGIDIDHGEHIVHWDEVGLGDDGRGSDRDMCGASAVIFTVSAITASSAHWARAVGTTDILGCSEGRMHGGEGQGQHDKEGAASHVCYRIFG